jgi:hypothetical protein
MNTQKNEEIKWTTTSHLKLLNTKYYDGNPGPRMYDLHKSLDMFIFVSYRTCMFMF